MLAAQVSTCEVFSSKIVFSTDLWKFSLWKVFHYTVWCNCTKGTDMICIANPAGQHLHTGTAEQDFEQSLTQDRQWELFREHEKKLLSSSSTEPCWYAVMNMHTLFFLLAPCLFTKWQTFQHETPADILCTPSHWYDFSLVPRPYLVRISLPVPSTWYWERSTLGLVWVWDQDCYDFC